MEVGTSVETGHVSKFIVNILKIQNDVLQELKAEYCMDKTCGVCYKPFITPTLDDYNETIEKIRLKCGERVALLFEMEVTICQCFSARFVCLTCKNNDICFGCLTEITKRKTIKFPDCEKVIIAKCPFCRTDKVLIPNGVLDDIRAHDAPV